ncbi:acetylcholinesterase-like [Wyeomyia smithii]|uniref:acetylcholinesterase-like n=1 Tax=Wyeomyia smithii TaxID=174621 RepID=UPI002467B99F|nr:acetylcholinesterase-like [Wyeomyia smithii]
MLSLRPHSLRSVRFVKVVPGLCLRMYLRTDSMVVVYRVLVGFIKHQFKNFIIRFWPGIERPIVQLPQGKVQGVTTKLPNGARYHFFKGIPYAQPPVGKLRFRPPVPLEKFHKPVLNCSLDSNDFIQRNMIFNWPVSGSEDGLYLNVYTPALPTENSTKYPVIVYIHGGGFRGGTANSMVYDPCHLVQQGVVVVTVFYRIGAFGFLHLPSVGISGNAGLKDQRLALHWIHKQIHHFGGDAHNVTLAGGSAGSWSTYLHYLSPSSRKYFHRVICSSGDACTEAVFQVDPEWKARALANALGCRGSSDQQVLDTLIKASARNIAKYQDSIIGPNEESCPHRFPFRPVIELEPSEDAIITQKPEEILKCFDSIQMPMMSGFTSAEGLLSMYLSKSRLELFNKHPEWLVPRIFSGLDAIERKAIGEQVKQFYLEAQDLGWNTQSETCDLMSDITFVVSAMFSAEMIAKYQPNVKHYHYLFDYSGPLNLIGKVFRLPAVPGAAHGAETYYMFSSSFLPNVSKDSREYRVREIFIKLVTNFAIHGNPTPDEKALGFKWTPVRPLERYSDSFDLESLQFTECPKMILNIYQKRKEFWRDLARRQTSLL